MKIVQIGHAGHCGYAYSGIKAHNLDFCGISAGNFGISKEGTAAFHKNLESRGFSPKLYENWKEMLAIECPDIVIVDSWYTDHGDIALYALEHGINVFCDKPIATDFDTLEKISKCDKAKIAAMFDARENSAFKAAKKAIDDGKIGKVRMMDSRKSYRLGSRPKFYSSRETYCGIIPWVAIHAIDWMRWLSGESYSNLCGAMVSRLDNGENGDMDITSSAHFLMTNDIIATVTADMYRPMCSPTHGDDRVRVVGTKGIVEITDGKAVLISDVTGNTCTLENEPTGDIFEDFLDQLAGKTNHLTKESCIDSTYWALVADEFALKRFQNCGECKS